MSLCILIIRRFDQHFTSRNQTVSILANITSHKYQLMKQQSHRKYTSTGKGVGLTDLLWYVFAQQCATFTYFYQPQGMYHVSIFIYYNCYKLFIISRQEINVVKLRKRIWMCSRYCDFFNILRKDHFRDIQSPILFIINGNLLKTSFLILYTNA